MGFMDANTLSSNLVKILPLATLFHFGILSSAMHMFWVNHVCGRLESDCRYSKDIVYNNFPWPSEPTSGNSPQPPLRVRGGAEGGGVMSKGKAEELVTAIEQAAHGVLDVRARYITPRPMGEGGAAAPGEGGSSLADLYDPVAMPPDLRRAHQELDKAVDTAYGKKSFASDAERVAFLFELYHKYTSLLPALEKTKKGKRKKG